MSDARLYLAIGIPVGVDRAQLPGAFGGLLLAGDAVRGPIAADRRFQGSFCRRKPSHRREIGVA